MRHSPSKKLIDRLAQQGVRFLGSSDQPRHLGLSYPARAVGHAALDALEACPLVEQVGLDALLTRVRPLDLTVGDIAAPATWATELEGLPLTGKGVRIGNVDSGLDVYHPAFFRADGGLYHWLDVNDNGRFDPGKDAVDLDRDGKAGEGETLGLIDAKVYDLSGKSSSFLKPILGSDNKRFDADTDWLYADTNGNGERDSGPSFGDEAPGFGEPLLVAEDLDGDGELDPEEGLRQLKTSKVQAIKEGATVLTRGKDLSTYTSDRTSLHGSGSCGVMVGGHRGYHRRVGVAPDADIVVMSTRTKDATLTDGIVWLVQQQKVDVILHEYAPYTGHHLDGSSVHERLLDDAAKLGVPQVVPAGNLAESDKHMRLTLEPNASGTVTFKVPGPYYGQDHFYVSVTLLWRDPAADLAFTLAGPAGSSKPLSKSDTSGTPWGDGQTSLYSYRLDSPRDTAMMNAYLMAGDRTKTGKVPKGTWTLEVKNPSSNKVVLLGYIGDALTSWSDGVEFTKHASKQNLVCFPATADSAITVGAYAGHVGQPYGDPGETSGALRAYSSRGKRIDGLSIMDLAAPDNPVVPLPRMTSLTELGMHMVYGGTSGAGPHVAGAAALIKQHKPSLDGLGVRDALRKGALADTQVGSVPSDSWGHGKLRIYSSVHGEAPPTNTPPEVELKLPDAVHAGVPVTLTPEATDAEGGTLEARWDRGYDGTYEGEFAPVEPREVTFSEPGWQRIKVEVRDSGGLTAAAAVRFEVKPAPADTTPPATDGGPGPGVTGGDDDGGCGCAVAAAPTRGGALLLLLALAAAWVRRRSRR